MQRSAAGQRESPASPGRWLAYLAGLMRFVEEPGGLGFAPGGGLMPAGMNRVVGSGPEVGGFGMGMPNGGLGGLGMSAHLLADVRPDVSGNHRRNLCMRSTAPSRLACGGGWGRRARRRPARRPRTAWAQTHPLKQLAELGLVVGGDPLAREPPMRLRRLSDIAKDGKSKAPERGSPGSRYERLRPKPRKPTGARLVLPSGTPAVRPTLRPRPRTPKARRLRGFRQRAREDSNL